MIHTPYVPNLTQTELTVFLCPVCKKKYPRDIVTQMTKDHKAVCTSCAYEPITVFQCSPKGFNKFTTDDINEVCEFIKNSDVEEVLEITKRRIARIKYMDADEFQGF